MASMESKQVMTVLPKEIIHYEILIRLPAKSLLSLKCVSKEWYNLINTCINFINLHHKRTLESPSFDDMVLLVPRLHIARVYPHFDVPLPKSHPLMAGTISFIVGCCNGLICLQLVSGYFALCNPLIESDYKVIPCLDSMPGRRSCNYSLYGFGYDNIDHVYKIVSIQKRRFGDALEQATTVVNVFSTGTCSWEVIEGFPVYTRHTFPGVSTNNKLHWINRYIINFDLHTHVIAKMSIPRIKRYAWSKCDLMVSGDGLLYLYMPVDNKEGMISQIWVMREYGVAESWIKLHNIARHYSHYWRLRTWILGFKPGDNGSTQVLLANSGNKLTWYNLHNNKSTNEFVVSEMSHNDGAKPWVCITTLVSPTHLQTLTP